MTLRTSALFSDPGRADVSGHFGTSVLPPLKPQRRPRQFKPFEAQSHGFCARLLRFVQGSPQCYARMAPGCRPALPGGLGFPLGHDRRFRSAIASHLPSPGFSWRQADCFFCSPASLRGLVAILQTRGPHEVARGIYPQRPCWRGERTDSYHDHAEEASTNGMKRNEKTCSRITLEVRKSL